MTQTLMLDATDAAPFPLARPPVQAMGLHLHFAGHGPVLDNLDWQIQPGQVVGLLGRNGAGKTTLLETLLGLREPSLGQVQLFGEPALQPSDALRARLGYVPQQSDLFDDFTPEQLLRYFRSFYPRWNEAKVDGLMSRWQIPVNRRIARLSQGQQQRLSIIRALAHDPDLLVLDEPVASLDPLGRRDFLRELVEQVLDRGTTVVFSTHILSDLERVAFNIAFLSGGKIALQAPQDQLAEEVRLLVGSEPALQAVVKASRAQVLHRRSLPSSQRWLVRFPEGQIPPPQAGLQCEALGLEDLFVELAQ
ncbi:ABC transporter ATP-binding protein [Roseateles depolymerans]|uniref:Putative ABC transporter ATP-binding protein n=1 Tax=Roseateles depolymerans TaxID=76731 RepID=A0A0U3LRW7_9BURK|nr:ABC transporter ATP-binding protein [Roseateles depolymerans]ALV09186.1 Putative ABC transporter ATP-binding protein [Roseateles depolymerans]REG13944.1 ABC-2 type transport system ATP-binding protein [Roseateles depolymerans]